MGLSRRKMVLTNCHTPPFLVGMEYHLHKLDEHFTQKRLQNSRYSLRAYARDLGIHVSTLSKVIKGQRSLPFSSLQRVTAVLGLDKEDQSKFCTSVLRNRGLGLSKGFDWIESPGLVLKNDQHFRIISEWEYFAFLNLMKLKSFSCQIKWVARRLGISESRARKVFADLKAAGLVKVLEVNGGEQWVRTESRMQTSDDVTSLALRIGHQNDLRLAASKMWDLPTELRDFCSLTLPAKPESLKKAKKMVREFLQQIEELMEVSDATEVYQVAVQIFPMTVIANQKKQGRD
jgi:uncharacterized protein (TIGR02147 family)